MKIMLEAKNLGKTYSVSKDNKQQVLKNVDLQIMDGEFVSVMGPSGSGKSTLLYNISGMDRMTEGSVTFDGQEISTLPEEKLATLRLNKMGFIFQQSHLLKNLSILDNVILSAYLAKNSSRETVNKRAAELMEKTGIAELANNDITQASGGQLQRVSICRALINNPSIVFGDEPTGALNSRATAEVMDILADINREKTTIMLVTHDARVAAKTERVIYMLDGSIISELQLGKYHKENGDTKQREENLSTWLNELVF